jgi:hypothetical protein
MIKRKLKFSFVPPPNDGTFDVGRFFFEPSFSKLTVSRTLDVGVRNYVSFGDEIRLLAPPKEKFAETSSYSIISNNISMIVVKQQTRSELLENIIAAGKSFDPNADIVPMMSEIIRTSRDENYIDRLVSSISPDKNHIHHAVLFLRMTSPIKTRLPSWGKLKSDVEISLNSKNKRKSKSIMFGL